MHCRGRDNLSTVSVNTLPESCSCSDGTAIGGYRHALPAPSEGGGRRPRSGRVVGVIQRERFSVARERQGKGRSAPSPSAPPPRGRYPIDALPGNRQPLYLQCEHPAGILFPLRARLSRVNRHVLPAPSRGGGRRRWKRRAVRVIYKYRSTGNASDRGRGVPPPPRQPSSTGVISHRRTAGEEATSLPSV